MAQTDNPIDGARTTRPRAGMVWKDPRQLAGLARTVVGVLALAGFATAIAVGDAGWAIGLGVVALVAAVSGVGWMLVERNRTAQGGNHQR